MNRYFYSDTFRMMLLFLSFTGLFIFFMSEQLLRQSVFNALLYTDKVILPVIASISVLIILITLSLYAAEYIMLRKAINISSSADYTEDELHSNIPQWLRTPLLKNFRALLNKTSANAELLRNLLNTTSSGILLCDPKGRILFANKTTGTILCSENNLQGIMIKCLFQNEYNGEFFQNKFPGIGLYTSFYWNALCEETPVPVFVNASSITLEDEPFLLFSITDFSDAQKAFEDLEFNITLLDNVFDPIMVRDFKGSIVFVNKAACRLYQYSKDELLSMDAEEIIFSTSLRDYREQINNLNNFPQCEMEIWHKRRNGTFIPILTSFTRFSSNDSDFIIETHHDLSENKRSQNALIESEERFKSFFDNAKDCVMIITANGTVLNINTAGKKLFGISDTDLSDFDFFEGFTDTLSRKDFESAMHQSGFVREFETILRKNDGSSVPVGINATYFHNPIYHLSGYNMFIRDLSIVRAMESRILQTHKFDAIGRVAGGIAHDFNNILTVILGNADAALSRVNSDNGLSGILSQIKESAIRASSLTSRLLSFGKKQEPNIEVISPNETIHILAKMLTRLISKDISLDLNTDPSVKAIRADKTQFEQIIVNLVLNARDSVMRKDSGGKRISIRTSCIYPDPSAAPEENLKQIVGPHVLIRVEDNGIGIPPENIEKIFDPFFTTKADDEAAGSGLGLSIVFGIAAQNNAQIFVTSGETTSFDIYWPLCNSEINDNKEPGSPEEVTGENETLLVIEDEMSLCQFTVAALKEKGFNVIGAKSAEEASKAADTDPSIALAFIDISMPDKNGIECARDLRRIIPGIKLLFTSGIEKESFLDDKGLKDIHFINKPYKISRLSTVIKQIIHNS